jgi:hypothetical protein
VVRQPEIEVMRKRSRRYGNPIPNAVMPNAAAAIGKRICAAPGIIAGTKCTLTPSNTPTANEIGWNQKQSQYVRNPHR